MRRHLVTLALVIVPRVAMAQISDADRATARVLAPQGQDALDRKDFTTAPDRFESARQIVPAPTLDLGLARAHVGLRHYNRILREGAPAGSPAAFAKGRF
jgi:hypothetical protein